MNQPIDITRRLEFDAGHRIPNHGGQCRHMHGHRYVIEVTLRGAVVEHQGYGDDGMVLDFGDIKKITNELIVEQWDHAFLVAKEDVTILNFLNSLPNHKTVVLAIIPTVENLAKIAFSILSPAFKSNYGNRLNLYRVRIYETPNCWADAYAR
jgi:6-pyruvoyltetrahydropterin/6-carboxytetrahydropterin synthase